MTTRLCLPEKSTASRYREYAREFAKFDMCLLNAILQHPANYKTVDLPDTGHKKTSLKSICGCIEIDCIEIDWNSIL